MSTGDIVIGISGDSADFRADIAKVEASLKETADAAAAAGAKVQKALAAEAAEAKALAADAAKLAKTLDKVATANSRAAAQATGFSALGKTTKTASADVGALGAAAAKTAGALDLVAPGAGEAARAIADAGDVGEVATSALATLGLTTAQAAAVAGPLALAVAAVGAALVITAREAAELDARLVLLNEEGRKGAETWAQLEAALLALDVAEGKVSEGQAKVQASALATQKQLDDLTDSYEAQMREADLAASSAETWATRVGFLGPLLGPVVDAVAGFSSTAEAQRVVVDDLTQSFGAQTERITAAGDATQRATEIAEAKREADERARKAVDALAEAQRRAEAAFLSMQESATAENARVGRVQSGIASLVAMTKESVDAQLEGEAKLEAAYKARVLEIGKVQAAAILAGRSEFEQDAAVAAGKQAATEAEKAYLHELDKLRAENADKEAERQKKAADEAQRMREREIASYDQSASQIADASAQLADVMGENHREAAMAFYAVSKAAALTQVAISTAVAIGKANELGPPASYIAMAAAGAVGAAQVATIAATPPPSFHIGTGTVGDGARVDEINARLQYREAVASRQGADILGRDNIDRANSGRAPRYGGDAPAVIRYRHKEYNEFIRDNIRQGGPLREALSAGKNIGHRTNRG